MQGVGELRTETDFVTDGTAASSLWILAGKVLTGSRQFQVNGYFCSITALLDGMRESFLFIFAIGEASPLVRGSAFPCEIFVTGLVALQ